MFQCTKLLNLFSMLRLHMQQEYMGYIVRIGPMRGGISTSKHLYTHDRV